MRGGSADRLRQSDSGAEKAQAGERLGGILRAVVADPASLDLSVLPPEYRAAFEGLIARKSELEELAHRQEALIAELHNALYGKKSEKLTEDERQLAFEDLEVAVSEVARTRRSPMVSDWPRRTSA